MQCEEFENLLRQSECDYLDFKRELYEFSREDKDVRAEFVKDVICMSNTPRQSDAYIIFGVEKHADGSYDLYSGPHKSDSSLSYKGRDDGDEEATYQIQKNCLTFPTTIVWITRTHNILW